jgi:hypothetical protein
MTRILRCGCKHPGQDALHGKGRRVHNDTSVRGGEYRCTVCGTGRSSDQQKKRSVVSIPKGKRMGGKKAGKKGRKGK